jgi:hypothetical protein
MDDLEDSKSFINANIDLVPSKLFLRALTAQKLSAQSNNDLEQMDFIKEVRRRYILAGDQVFFPLNIEVQKAETRVMTYLARDELRSFAENWDEVRAVLYRDLHLSLILLYSSLTPVFAEMHLRLVSPMTSDQAVRVTFHVFLLLLPQHLRELSRYFPCQVIYLDLT